MAALHVGSIKCLSTYLRTSQRYAGRRRYGAASGVRPDSDQEVVGTQLHEKNFTFYGAVQELEASLIERALELEGGSITRAAKRLGLKRQSLNHMLQSRHKNLLDKRTPPKKRLRSIIRESED